MTYSAEAAGANLELLATVQEDGSTILLLGPREPGFWAAFSTSPEYTDGLPDPMDRWSKRVIGTLAQRWGGEALFPSDGPPYPPFIAWALGSGQIWSSPVTLLVHAHQGLWTSFRGAVRVPGSYALPEVENPCESCAGQPCRSACPVNALTAEGYDVAACKAFLDQPEGQDCRDQGCAVRRACPVGQGYDRLAEQSRFHMRAFHPT
ncbi:MAG: ferredoxin [Maritimibacter sp.]